MEYLKIGDIVGYVEDNISVFHQKRLEGLSKLSLNRILKKKNPYLFKAKNVLTAEQIVRGIVDAHISSSEEAIFGDWLEGLAIFINGKAYGGRKSGIPNIDLEFDKNNVRYIVNIKSGPNWGNSSQVKKLEDDFNKAKKTLRTSNSNLVVSAVNGCCYGKENMIDKGSYLKLCGQIFWEFISGEKDFYLEIIEPLGFNAREKNDGFIEVYNQKLNLFTADFIEKFCANGRIDWAKLVAFNSGAY